MSRLLCMSFRLTSLLSTRHWLTYYIASALSLRRDPRILKLPPYLSFLCIAVGVVWLFLLPLNEYSRRTYISENALLPGQVHTYFGGSEQNIFRAYRYEVDDVADKNNYECVLSLDIE
jgi:glycosylphosphatidylinositol transamidase